MRTCTATSISPLGHRPARAGRGFFSWTCALTMLACAGVSCVSRTSSPSSVPSRLLDRFRDGHPYLAAERIRIDAPRDSVWAMLGTSALARKWSVVVHHIDVLSGRDGVIGTVRRCYLCPSGTFDERVVALEPPSYRKLTTVGTGALKGVLRDIAGSCAYQNLDSLDDHTSELQLTVTYRLSYGPLDPIVNAVYASPKLHTVLARNLANMKALVESGARYQRVYPFEGDETRCPAEGAITGHRRATRD